MMQDPSSTTSGRDPKEVKQAKHEALITSVIQKTIKVKKEIGTRNRKLKELYDELDTAIFTLESFKDVSWPQPKHTPITPPTWVVPPEEIFTEATNVLMSEGFYEDTTTANNNINNNNTVSDDMIIDENHNTENSNNNTGNDYEDVDSQMVVVTDNEGTVDDDDDENGESNTKNSSLDGDCSEEKSHVVVEHGDVSESSSKSVESGYVNVVNENTDTEIIENTTTTNTATANHGHPSISTLTTVKSTTSSSSSLPKNTVSIQPNKQVQQELLDTEEPMHPDMASVVTCYCHALIHPHRTSKIVELVLEIISLLIKNRYVSGGTLQNNNSHIDDDGDNSQSTPKVAYLVNCICRCADSTSELTQSGMVKALLALMTSPICGVHEAAMLKSVRATFHVYLVTKYTTVKEFSRATLLDMLRSVFSRMEAYDAMNPSHTQNGTTTNTTSKTDESSTTNSHNETSKPKNTSTKQRGNSPVHGPDSSQIFLSRFHTDSYLLFRALCKLSAKPLPEDADDFSTTSGTSSATKRSIFSNAATISDPLSINSKILSLELILAVFECCGPAFRKGEKFIYAVQNYLCVSLLKNCISSNTDVAHLSLKIFLLLVYKFKSHLKSEIEVFILNIFLPVLESPNSPIEQKRLVLEALRSLCGDPLLLTQIFLNYDCDFDAVNLYGKIVHHLTSLSIKGRSVHNVVGGKNTTSISVAGLEVLVVTLRAFLRALDLPGGDDIFDIDDSELTHVRGSLQLDVGLAAKAAIESPLKPTGRKSESMNISAKEIETMEENAAPYLSAMNEPMSPANVIGDAYERKRLAQQNFETGSVKFTLSIKQGLLFFIEYGFVHLDAENVAKFFLDNKDRLDKTQIGEVLGREPHASFVKDEGADPEKGGEGFFVRILYHYVDALDFSDMEFDEAIRLFLSGFRLPGEAQKIDRIMEKFAERYTKQNSSIFPSADTAFILAFSVIMLQTDLHNPSIKPEKRMTLESFIRNNRGIAGDSKDLPESLLTGIFKRIQAQPFTLKEDDDARLSLATKDIGEQVDFFGMGEERRREKFRKERAEIMTSSEMLFKKKIEKSSSSSAFELAESICPADVVKPMFNVTWGPLLGTLSQILEMVDDDASIALSLNAFVYSIRIAAHIGMTLTRNTYVNTLAKFTTLGSVKEMKRKNIESIRTLLSIAIMDGEFLGESWRQVLECISQLGRLQLFASGLASDDTFLTNDDPKKLIPRKEPSADNAYFKQATKLEMARETEENNGRAVLGAINEVLIEKVFTSTVNLSAKSIIMFVECLVAVSETELGGDSKKVISGVGRSPSLDLSLGPVTSPSSPGDGPRIFSLQKLVEVADYNMNSRPRLSWSKIWEIMSKHLIKIGSHKNFMVSMFAVDALRQLSSKFVEKPELADFNFQRLFLSPFLAIMENPDSREDIREMVLRCVDNTIRSMAHKLRSGWKIFFAILKLSASDPSEKINTLGLAILQRLLDDNLDLICKCRNDDACNDVDDPKGKERNAKADDFVSLCRASLSFVSSKKDLPVGLSMRALSHAACYADLLASNKILPPTSGAQTADPNSFGYTYAGLDDVESLEMVLWRPILDGLAKGISYTSDSVNEGVGCVIQHGSILAMRAILLRHGKHFSLKQWSIILDQVILPMLRYSAENDLSPVINITSESPATSNLDFLVEPLELPPQSGDEDLLKFAEVASALESAPFRQLGDAELLLEASFADLRHGGDGNLRVAHELLMKANDREWKDTEQPFPDSWVATTAPIALGMVTDIFSEIILKLGNQGQQLIWPLITCQIEHWVNGNTMVENYSEDVKAEGEAGTINSWIPCEALVRISCKEYQRLLSAVARSLPDLEYSEGQSWLHLCCNTTTKIIKQCVVLESSMYDKLVNTLDHHFDLMSQTRQPEDKERGNHSANDEKSAREKTPYGKGSIIEVKSNHYEEDGASTSVQMNVIQLEFGATLYSPTNQNNKTDFSRKTSLTIQIDTSDEPSVDASVLQNSLNQILTNVPPLKVRCVASFCIQQTLIAILDSICMYSEQDEIFMLLEALEQSCHFASIARANSDVSYAFKELLLIEWGAVEELSPSLSPDLSVGHRGRSEMFFLTQEASANNVIIQFLSMLYCATKKNTWDTETFAENRLIERMMDILQNFITSETKEGHLINPNVWRMSSESGGKIAIYCTSFAIVVVNILNTVGNFSKEQLDRQMKHLFPILCSLVTVQSDEIRSLLATVLKHSVGPLFGCHLN